MKISRTLPGALAALLLAAPLAAQQGMPQQAPPDSIQEIFREFQTLQARIAQTQDSAMSVNPDLVAQQQEIQAFVEEVMVEVNPEVEGQIERLDTLQQQFEQAQAAQDTARLQELAAEGNEIQQTVMEAQAQAMEREDVQARLESFQEDMLDAMAQIDDGIEEAMDRAEDLASRLQAYQESMGG